MKIEIVLSVVRRYSPKPKLSSHGRIILALLTVDDVLPEKFYEI